MAFVTLAGIASTKNNHILSVSPLGAYAFKSGVLS